MGMLQFVLVGPGSITTQVPRVTRLWSLWTTVPSFKKQILIIPGLCVKVDDYLIVGNSVSQITYHGLHVIGATKSQN